MSRVYAALCGGRAYREQSCGTRDLFLQLSRWPITTVTAVTVGSGNPVVVDPAEYMIADPERAALYRANGWAQSTVTVEYEAGWKMPGEGASELDELPALLQIAAEMQVVDWFRGGGEIPLGIASQRTPEVTTTFHRHLRSSVMPAVWNMLQAFR